MKRLHAVALLSLLALPATAKDLDVAMGKALFDRPWAAAGASNTRSDGLGPLFTARSCVACHPRGGAGRLPDENGQGLGLVLRFDADPVYGRQLQSNGVHGQPAEGRLEIAWSDEAVSLPDGTEVALRRPRWTVADPAYGPPPDKGSLRLAPSLAGVGRLAAIPRAAIEAAAALPRPDGIAGILPPGRFGLKGSNPDLHAQTSEALLLDIGLASADHPEPWGDCTPAQSDCRHARQGASAEAGAELDEPVIAAIVAYLAALPPPVPTAPPDAAGLALFERTGCSACHRPTLAGVPAWTDLLLHDLGPDLADDMDGLWRTAPLWGLGRRLQAQAPLLHDGRGRNALEAILWHGGQAAAARDRFAALPATERDRLLAFLEGL